MKKMKKNYIGMKFNNWTVINQKETSNLRVFCRCICGKEKYVFLQALKSEKSKSCGCQRPKTRKSKHGLSSTSEYRTWSSIKNNCYPSTNRWTKQSECGIVMCKEWKDDFLKFLKDMGKKPGKNFKLWKKDFNKNYTPENCYWKKYKKYS